MADGNHLYYSHILRRAKKSGSRDHPHEYLQIVESYRDSSSVRQGVIATMGRLDQLKSSGRIDGLMQSVARFSAARF